MQAQSKTHHLDLFYKKTHCPLLPAYGKFSGHFGYNLNKIMLYDSLKILHILSATLLLTSLIYSYRIWLQMKNIEAKVTVAYRIQIQTWLIIIPSAIFQLATGFTMISLKHNDLSELWIVGSVIGFIVLMGSWFSFVYFLLSSQQSVTNDNFFRRIQSIMLILTTIALLSIIFLMTNKITG